MIIIFNKPILLRIIILEVGAYSHTLNDELFLLNTSANQDNGYF